MGRRESTAHPQYRRVNSDRTVRTAYPEAYTFDDGALQIPDVFDHPAGGVRSGAQNRAENHITHRKQNQRSSTQGEKASRWDNLEPLVQNPVYQDYGMHGRSGRGHNGRTAEPEISEPLAQNPIYPDFSIQRQPERRHVRRNAEPEISEPLVYNPIQWGHDDPGQPADAYAGRTVYRNNAEPVMQKQYIRLGYGAPEREDAAYAGQSVRRSGIDPSVQQQAQESLDRRQKRVNSRSRSQAMGAGSVLILALACAAGVFFCAQYLQLRQRLISQNETIEQMESSLTRLKADNDAYENRTRTMVNLEDVKKAALGRLGLNYAKESQIRYYNADDESYVRQYTDVGSR